MDQVLSGSSSRVVHVSSWKTYLVGILLLMLFVSGNESAQAVTGGSPYEVSQVKDGNNDPNIVETWIVAEETLPGAPIYIAPGVPVKNAMTFKSCANAQLSDCTVPGIPGPEFRLKVGDRVIVHFVNKLGPSGLNPEANVSGIHWHGIELNNESDGTEVTQHAVARYVGGTPIPVVSNPQDPAQGIYDYDFTVSRPGIFWYHPHHHSSTNQVAKGLYGSIIIEDKHGYEAALIAQNVIPSAAQTKTLVISDITVCNAPGTGTNPATFDGNLPHVSGVQAWEINYQNHILTQSPLLLCETHPIDANGAYRQDPYQAGDVPNIQSDDLIGPMSEGFTVLTNGVQVDARGGSPSAPADPSSSVLANALEVQAGQGLRLQIVNPSPVRYLRLRLTTNNGKQVDLVRIGGEGGLLNKAVVEGGVEGGFDSKYGRGEILLPPAGRADVVAEIPRSTEQHSVLTLWTEDFQRVAATYSWTPTVPVMHLKVNGRAATPYSIGNSKPLLASLGAQAMVKVLGAPTGDLVVPSGEAGADGKPAGSVDKDIKLTFFNNTGAFQPSIDGVPMPRDFNGDFDGNPFYLESARHAELDKTMELTVTNVTGAHHPFHLHGFSVQPITLAPRAGTKGPTYKFPPEFRDIVDVPENYTLTFRVSLDDHLKPDLSPGGGKGRWLFHCHILPHATFGMMSELHVH